jgi:hypothetical protein
MTDQPPRDVAVVTCLQAWGDLSTCRQIGMAVGPIPWTAIVAWCDRRGLDPDAAELVTRVIRVLDVQRAEAETAKRDLEKTVGKGKR